MELSVEETKDDKSLNEVKDREQLRLERRIRRQAKNKTKKEESKRLREEGLRRKLCEPKDQRVRLIQRNTLASLISQPRRVNDCTSVVPNITSDEFPSLEFGSKLRDKRQVKSTSLTDKVERVCFNDSPETVKSKDDPPSPVKEPIQIQQTKLRPKRNDPIQINVMVALKKVESAHGSEIKGVAKKDSPPRLFGNQLDASNPERKRGKVREIPREKKPTQLKRVILQERETKKLNPEIIPNSNAVPDAVLLSTMASHLSSEDCIKTQEDNTKRQEVLQEDKDFNNFAEEDRITSPKTSDASQLETLDLDTINNQLKLKAKMSIHNRKFREYCDHSLSPELNLTVTALITDIVKFQDRMFFSDPIKAHSKRRFILGFRESKKYLTFKKIKLLIIAPDLETIKSTGGIDDMVDQLKAEANAQEVPYLFALGRKGLKKLTNKSFKVQGISCIGILNYEGSQDNFHALLDHLPRLRLQYSETLAQAERHFNVPQVVEVTKEEEVIEEPLDIDAQIVRSFLLKLSEGVGKG